MCEEEYSLAAHLESNEAIWDHLTEKGVTEKPFELEFEFAPGKSTSIDDFCTELSSLRLIPRVKKIKLLIIKMGTVVYATSERKVWTLESIQSVTRKAHAVCERHDCLIVECGASVG